MDFKQQLCQMDLKDCHDVIIQAVADFIYFTKSFAGRSTRTATFLWIIKLILILTDLFK